MSPRKSSKFSEKLYPIWYQYEVRPTEKNPEKDLWSGGLANLIVFASSDEDGRAKCGRHIAFHHWEITNLKRASAITEKHLEALEKVFEALYKQAELSGIAVRFDGWRIATSR